MVSNGKNIDLNDKGCVEPTSLIIKSTCLIICFSLIFFFYKVSIKNRFLYKMLFFSFAPTSSSAAHDGNNNDGDSDEDG